jgi:hypothetical protein
MIDHEVFYRELVRTRRDRGRALEREELLELLIAHLAQSSHRLALPAEWTTEQVASKLRVVFKGDPLIADMLDAFDARLRALDPGHANTTDDDEGPGLTPDP